MQKTKIARDHTDAEPLTTTRNRHPAGCLGRRRAGRLHPALAAPIRLSKECFRKSKHAGSAENPVFSIDQRQAFTPACQAFDVILGASADSSWGEKNEARHSGPARDWGPNCSSSTSAKARRALPAFDHEREDGGGGNVLLAGQGHLAREGRPDHEIRGLSCGRAVARRAYE